MQAGLFLARQEVQKACYSSIAFLKKYALQAYIAKHFAKVKNTPPFGTPFGCVEGLKVSGFEANFPTIVF